LRSQIPVAPSQRRILAICIVIAILCLPELITCKQHRYTLRKKERGQEISLLLQTHYPKRLRVCTWRIKETEFNFCACAESRRMPFWKKGQPTGSRASVL